MATPFQRGDADRIEAIATGFTKKFKIVDRHKYATTYGKMMGDDPPENENNALKSFTVVFVNSKGERVDVDLNRPAKEMRVIEHKLDAPIGVRSVR